MSIANLINSQLPPPCSQLAMLLRSLDLVHQAEVSQLQTRHDARHGNHEQRDAQAHAVVRGVAKGKVGRDGNELGEDVDHAGGAGAERVADVVGGHPHQAEHRDGVGARGHDAGGGEAGRVVGQGEEQDVADDGQGGADHDDDPPPLQLVGDAARRQDADEGGAVDDDGHELGLDALVP